MHARAHTHTYVNKYTYSKTIKPNKIQTDNILTLFILILRTQTVLLFSHFHPTLNAIKSIVRLVLNRPSTISQSWNSISVGLVEAQWPVCWSSQRAIGLWICQDDQSSMTLDLPRWPKFTVFGSAKMTKVHWFGSAKMAKHEWLWSCQDSQISLTLDLPRWPNFNDFGSAKMTKVQWLWICQDGQTSVTLDLPRWPNFNDFGSEKMTKVHWLWICQMAKLQWLWICQDDQSSLTLDLPRWPKFTDSGSAKMAKVHWLWICQDGLSSLTLDLPRWPKFTDFGSAKMAKFHWLWICQDGQSSLTLDLLRWIKPTHTKHTWYTLHCPQKIKCEWTTLLTLFWRSQFSWVTFHVSNTTNSLVCQFLLVAQFIEMSMTKTVFLWYQSQRDVHLFWKFRMTFTWTQNIEKSSNHDGIFRLPSETS